VYESPVNSIDFVRCFYYFEDDGTLVDEDGEIVFNIYDWITPNQFYLFKHLKQSIAFDKNGCYVEFIHQADYFNN
jgi:hypothetical protein